MPPPPLPPDEQDRLADLDQYAVLDTPPEASFDRLTRIAAKLFSAPIALISLVDMTRQWFKSTCGLNVKETPRGQAFCAYAILNPKPLVVIDPQGDARFFDNPLVTGPPFIRYYVGAPLITSEGFRLGTMCVIDTKAGREYPSDEMLCRLEDLAAEAVSQLEQRLQAAALLRAKNDAEAATQAKSAFLAMMSHEVRTPMNGVLGMTDVLLQSTLNTMQRNYMNIIRSSANSMLELINDILDFSKIEAGRLELDSVRFNLRDLVEETAMAVGLLAHQKNLELVCNVDCGLPEFVIGDVTRVRQVLSNLLGNAIKFTLRGEVEVRVSRDNAYNSPVDKDLVSIQFSVRDTGIGIPRDKQGLIFEAFSQADCSTTRKFGGTGLGLSISSRLAQAMGGRIWVDSEVGKGSNFQFTVILSAVAESIGLNPLEAVVSLAGTRVLVVDDNGASRRVLSEMLQGWEIDVVGVASEAESLVQLRGAIVEGKPFRVVLIDAGLPEVDQAELVKQMHAACNDVSGDAPAFLLMVVQCCGKSMSQTPDPEIAGHLTKPIRRDAMRKAITLAIAPSAPANHSASADPSRAVVAAGGQTQALQRNLQILLVEDNSVNQMVASLILEAAGHRVVVACSGHEALSAVNEQCFDLVFMDVEMPDMDGLQATEVIRESEKLKGTHLPIVAITGHAMRGDRERCLLAGMDNYITKPISSKILLQMVAHMVPASAR